MSFQDATKIFDQLDSKLKVEGLEQGEREHHINMAVMVRRADLWTLIFHPRLGATIVRIYLNQWSFYSSSLIYDILLDNIRMSKLWAKM